ncbi:Uncharacterized protein Fot_07164 [Forsythia ovata]|uniref:Uncharacterized protein n=1 Tax=Forsythia ovata TaxID=205694 RepID=A0ABD1WV14_9LAMI
MGIGIQEDQASIMWRSNSNCSCFPRTHLRLLSCRLRNNQTIPDNCVLSTPSYYEKYSPQMLKMISMEQYHNHPHQHPRGGAPLDMETRWSLVLTDRFSSDVYIWVTR